MPPRLTAASLTLAALLSACAGAPPPTLPVVGRVREGTPDDVNIAKARARGQEQIFSWQPWSAASFARARREGRHVLVHGAATWCHWCHVMEETTYRDPEVGRILRDRFVAIRVDIDARPDLEERYGAWGWPATILLDSEAREVGKYRGYLRPDQMREALSAVEGARVETAVERLPRPPVPSVEAMAWVGALAAGQMDDYYDPEGGSWGYRQKVPLGDNVSFELRRAGRGDTAALGRARFTLAQHARLIDPVWGGVYQYSTGSGWTEIHYEKLMLDQAENLTAFAEGYAATGDEALLAHARDVARYMSTFLSNDAGGFLTTQDADVGAHDRAAAFVDGDVYYRLDDAGRRALGFPRVDEHVYAEENGAAIAAMCALHAASADAEALARARRAADLLLRTHVDGEGRVKHDADSARDLYFAADAGALGHGLVRLAEITGEARYAEAALRIARALTAMQDPVDGGLWASTPDPDAAGVFSTRRKPADGNVWGARLFAGVGRLTSDEAWRERAREVLRRFSRPEAIRAQGRMVGGYLLALDEAGLLAWPAVTPPPPPHP